MKLFLRKALWGCLVLVFLAAVVPLVVKVRRTTEPTMISLPSSSEATPFPSPLPSPVVNPTNLEVESDLKMIETDLTKTKEDQRLRPPEFIFDLRLKQD